MRKTILGAALLCTLHACQNQPSDLARSQKAESALNNIVRSNNLPSYINADSIRAIFNSKLAISVDSAEYYAQLVNVIYRPVIDNVILERDLNNSIRYSYTEYKVDLNELKKEIQGFKLNDYLSSQEDIRNAASQFESWSSDILKEESSGTDKKLTSQLKSKLVQTQISSYPTLRNRYIKFTAKNLWRDNIKVTGSGSTIRYSGGTFANNAMIEDFHYYVAKDLELLRFKRAEYIWMDYADEYTFYTLETPKDSKLVN